jgi:hypothetical protein
MFATGWFEGVGGSTRAVRRPLRGLWLLGFVVACGGAAPPPPQVATEDDALLRDQVLDEVMAEENAKRAAKQSRSAKTNPAGAGTRVRATVGVRGITGSLTAFDVEQAMSRRRAELLACVKQRPRALGHVAGDIAFHIDVDAAGKVERALVMQSDIGYPPLEQCLLAVVAAAPFPTPAGAERAEAQWRMSVDPLREPATPLDSAELEETITREAEGAYETCQIPKASRFVVNGYLARGKLHPVSVRAPWRGPAQNRDDASEQITCLAEALEQWRRWPKQSAQSKLSFELRWVKAPPPERARGRRRR